MCRLLYPTRNSHVAASGRLNVATTSTCGVRAEAGVCAAVCAVRQICSFPVRRAWVSRDLTLRLRKKRRVRAKLCSRPMLRKKSIIVRAPRAAADASASRAGEPGAESGGRSTGGAGDGAETLSYLYTLTERECAAHRLLSQNATRARSLPRPVLFSTRATPHHDTNSSGLPFGRRTHDTGPLPANPKVL